MVGSTFQWLTGWLFWAAWTTVISSGCTATRFIVPEAQLTAISEGRVSPCRIVFIVPGIFNDWGSSWCEDLQRELSRKNGPNAVGVVLRYWTTPIGMWLNTGGSEASIRLAELADRIERRHAESGCGVELELYAVGFSHGSEVIVRALRSVSARFDRVLLLQSSMFALSSGAAELIESGAAREVCSAFSPIDVATFLIVPFGQGTFGGLGLDNELIWRFHWPWFSECYLRWIEQHLLDRPQREAGTTPFSEDLREVLIEATAPVDKPQGTYDAMPY